MSAVAVDDAAKAQCMARGRRSAGDGLSLAALPEDLRQELRRHFSNRRASYVGRVMSASELRVTNVRDSLILARIKRMSARRLSRFDKFIPAGANERRAFQAAQMEWLRGEEYLLACRLGRRPTHAEFSADFNAHRNGQRFRAFYVMKYPEQMIPCGMAKSKA